MSTPETDAIRSALAAKELDEMLSVFSSGPEDCWTDPAKRAARYVADLRYDLLVQTNRAAILAEVNDTLRGMIDDLAAYAGTHFGTDEPVKNFEATRSALAEKGSMRAFIEQLASEGPAEEPERYTGDNHGDTEKNAQDISDWYLAKRARAALTPTPTLRQS